MRCDRSRSKGSAKALAGVAFGLGVCLIGAGRSDGALIYNIASFDANDATTASSTTVQYDPALVSITTAAGVTGTSAAQLLTLQTINLTAGTGTAGSRFQNTDLDAAQTNGTLIADALTNYFQFGVVAAANGSLSLDSLTFQAKKATGGVATRGYNVVVSVNGGPYTALGAANVTADRNTAPFDAVSLPTVGASFQGITSVDFRVNSTGGGVEYTNFAVNGTVAVPEPGTMSALGGGLLAAAAVRRRRRRA